MDMNFPHPKRRHMQPHRGGKYAELVAAAMTRQMAGITTQFAACGSDSILTSTDPVGARMQFFAAVKSNRQRTASGSFMPAELLEPVKVNKTTASVYPDALANGKPYLFTESSPELPVALRGMEN